MTKSTIPKQNPYDTLANAAEWIKTIMCALGFSVGLVIILMLGELL